MSLFFLTFFSIYGAGHLYAFYKAWPVLGLRPTLARAVAFFMLFMLCGPIGVRLLEGAGHVLTARLLAFVSYTWMGLLLFFVSLAFCVDVYNVGLRLAGFLFKFPAGEWIWDGKSRLCVLILGCLILGAWSVMSARDVRLERVTVETDKLPAGMQALRIVQISDLHLGLVLGDRFLERVIARVKEARPDVLVCTGDLVDAQADALNHLAEPLAAIRPALGKFAVTGNHEFYAGIDQSERFLAQAGFELLRGERRYVGDALLLAGVDDPAVSYRGKKDPSAVVSEKALLPEEASSRVTVLLKHRPVVSHDALGRFDLQLSGHTHNGQIFPFTFVTRLYYPLQSGTYRLPKESLLYVSRGAGTWGPPMRFLSPPHVTLFEVTGPLGPRRP